MEYRRASNIIRVVPSNELIKHLAISGPIKKSVPNLIIESETAIYFPTVLLIFSLLASHEPSMFITSKPVLLDIS